MNAIILNLNNTQILDMKLLHDNIKNKINKSMTEVALHYQDDYETYIIWQDLGQDIAEGMWLTIIASMKHLFDSEIHLI